MTHGRISWIVAAILGLGLHATLQAAGEAALLAPTGTLRVVYLSGNPVQATVDPQTKAVTGPAADISRELARRLGVPVQIAPIAGVRAVLDALVSHTSDLGFLAFDASRAAEVDFTQPYELAYNTFLVSADSPLQSVAAADREGVRIAAPKGDSGDLYLSRTLKHAELKSIPGLTVDDARRMLATKQIDAFATNRQRLAEAADRYPGLRLLPDNFFAVEQALIVPKGSPAQIQYLNRFLDDLRASGFLQAAIQRARLSGVEVTPPRKP